MRRPFRSLRVGEIGSMPYRFAVLWEPTVRGSRPVGLAVEQDEYVLVEVREDLAMPTQYQAPFDVLGPDMTMVRYRPGDRGYFDQVMLDLSRAFIIGQEGRINEASDGVVLRLLRTHVFEPLRKQHQEIYRDTAGTFPAVQSYRRS